MDTYIKRLEDRGINPTAVRSLIFKTMVGFTRAFSLADLENELETVDKSTLSRAIHLFLDKHLIHSIYDGSGSIKYSVCGNSCNCALEDLHPHFYCTRCGKAFCLENISIPQIDLPQGLILESINFVLKGICNDCSKFAT